MIYSAEAHALRTVLCKSCQKKIIFLRTANGKRMPVDADQVSQDDSHYDPSRHVSHFKTCNDPNRFSGSKPRG